MIVFRTLMATGFVVALSGMALAQVTTGFGDANSLNSPSTAGVGTSPSLAPPAAAAAPAEEPAPVVQKAEKKKPAAKEKRARQNAPTEPQKAM